MEQKQLKNITYGWLGLNGLWWAVDIFAARLYAIDLMPTLGDGAEILTNVGILIAGLVGLYVYNAYFDTPKKVEDSDETVEEEEITPEEETEEEEEPSEEEEAEEEDQDQSEEKNPAR